MELEGHLMSDVERNLEHIRLLWTNLELQVPTGSTPATDHDPATLKIADGALVGMDLSDRLHLVLTLADPEEEMRRRLTAGIVVRTKSSKLRGATSKPAKSLQSIAGVRDRTTWLLTRMERGSITLGVVKEVVEEHRALWPREPSATPLSVALSARCWCYNA